MAERSDIQNTLGGTDFGTSLKNLDDGDLTRGYFDASPGSNEFPMLAGASHEIGQLEDESFRDSHGLYDEYGFVRRPLYRGDVERN